PNYATPNYASFVTPRSRTPNWWRRSDPARPAGDRRRAVQSGAGLPGRAAAGPGRGVPGGAGRLRLAPGADAGGGHRPGAVPGRPRHPGRPDLALLVPELPEAVRPAVPVLHSG